MKSKIGFLLCLLVFTACNESSVDLQFTVPNGYKGVLKIRQHQPDGGTLSKGKRIEINFDSTGVIHLNGETPSLRWHSLSARYTDGTIIPVIEYPAQTPPTTFGLWRVGGVRDNEDWYVIGTLDEVKTAMELRDGFKWPSR